LHVVLWRVEGTGVRSGTTGPINVDRLDRLREAGMTTTIVEATSAVDSGEAGA
jgi:hypothetical protein